MKSIKKKLEKSLHSQPRVPKKIVIVPDGSSFSRTSGPTLYRPDPSISSENDAHVKADMDHSRRTKVPEIPVAQLIDLSIPENPAEIRVTSLQSDPTWSWTSNEPAAPTSKLLLYLPLLVQKRLLRMLPIKDLTNLSCVNRLLNQLAKEEMKRREGHLTMQLVWRKDFIRYMNQTYNAGNKITLMRHHVFGPIWKDLVFPPGFLIVCYTPDIFEYEIRLQVPDDHPQSFESATSHNVFKSEETGQDFTIVKEKAGTLLNNLMSKNNVSRSSAQAPSSIWHMRLFTVLKPANEAPSNIYLWNSEDLTLLFFPKSLKTAFHKGPIEYSDLMDYPMIDRYYTNNTMLRPMIEMINHRYRPKFLLLTVNDFPVNFQPVIYPFPIVVCDISPFKTYSEEFLAISGADTKVFQVVLDQHEERPIRDEKIRMLRRQCGPEMEGNSSTARVGSNLQVNKVYGRDGGQGNTGPDGGQWIVFYLTEMWPGGTSKEMPLADTVLLRTLFPNSPVIGGRGKHFLANQIVSSGRSTVYDAEPGVMRRMSIPTVITAVFVT